MSTSWSDRLFGGLRRTSERGHALNTAVDHMGHIGNVQQ